MTARIHARLFWLPLAAAAAARLAFALFLPLADHGNHSYLQPALELLETGRYISFGTLHRLPGAPWFFAFWMGLLGTEPRHLVLVQHGLGLAGLWLLMRLARAAWGDRAALCAGILLGLQLLFPYQECFLLSEAVAQFLLVASLVMGLRLRRNPGARLPAWACAGAAAALAGLTRGELLVVGPLWACALACPGAAPRRRFGLPVFCAAWLFLVAGWAARNRALFGYGGLTPETATLALDTAWPLVRYDLPTQALAKRVLAEQVAARDASAGVDPRPTTLLRLQREHGMSYLEAQVALGAVVREAILTQPIRYLGLARRNFSLRPAPWLDQDRRLPGVRYYEGTGGAAQDRFWSILAAAQHWGWGILAAAALAPLALLLRRFQGSWGPALLAALYLSLLGATLFFRPTSARIQAELYIPLGLLGAFALDALAGLPRELALAVRRLAAAAASRLSASEAGTPGRMAGAALAGLAALSVAAACWHWAVMPPPAPGLAFEFSEKDYRHYYLDIQEPLFRAVPGGDRTRRLRTNRAGIRPAEFRMPKPPGTFRIFLIGGSVAQRLDEGREGEGWTRRLQSMAPGTRLEWINVGAVGYDSARDLLGAREVLDYDPDLLVVLSGNNEFLSPVRLERPQLAYAAFRLRRLAGLPMPAPRPGPAAAPDGPAARDVGFETNLRALVRAAAARGVPVVLCTLPNNLADFAPQGALPLGDPQFAAGWEALHGAGGSAVAAFTRFLARNPDSALGRFYLAKALERAGRREEALAGYREAADRDGDTRRCPPRRNRLLRRIAKAEGAILADLEAEFDAADPRGGVRFFYDGVHWHPQYNALAAAAVALACAEQRVSAGSGPPWDPEAVRRWRAQARRPDLSGEPGRENLWRLLVQVGAVAAHAPFSEQSEARCLELIAGLDHYLPGTVGRLAGLKAEFIAAGIRATRTWWGGTAPERVAAEVESWWPHLLRLRAAALRRPGGEAP